MAAPQQVIELRRKSISPAAQRRGKTYAAVKVSQSCDTAKQISLHTIIQEITSFVNSIFAGISEQIFKISRRCAAFYGLAQANGQNLRNAQKTLSQRRFHCKNDGRLKIDLRRGRISLSKVQRRETLLPASGSRSAQEKIVSAPGEPI